MNNPHGLNSYLCFFESPSGAVVSLMGYANNPQYAIENARRELIKNTKSTEWKYVRHQLIKSR